MMRTAALAVLGLLLAVVVGYGVHLITRETISLPVVQLEQPARLAPPAATTTAHSTTTETETGGTATKNRGTETDDNSGSGSSRRGRGRGGSGDDD